MSAKQVLRGYRQVRIRQGDTLQSIAQRELGKAERWVDLISLNALVSPYIVDSLDDYETTPETGRVLLAGMWIRVPSPPRPFTTVLDPDDIFGTDIKLSLGLLEAAEDGDYLLVAGEPNLTQALQNRIDTPEGELIWHPYYGSALYRLLGRQGSNGNQLLAQAYAARTLRSDGRVSQVKNLTTKLVGDQLQIGGTVVAIDGRSLPIGGASPDDDGEI